jgi:hypothetical protein
MLAFGWTSVSWHLFRVPQKSRQHTAAHVNGVMFLENIMPEYKTLLEFSRPEFVKDLSVNRIQEQGLLKVWLLVSKGDSEQSIELSGFDDLARSISSLLEAERAVISKEINSSKEFGTIRIECWVDEDYSEYSCDAAD